MKIKNILILLGLSIIIFGPMLLRLKVSNTDPTRSVNIKPIVKVDSIIPDTFSEDKLVNFMYDNNILFPSIVLAQAKLETGNFKSYLFKESNNLFGFRNFNGYIKYKDWKSSAIAYKEWQKKKYKKGDYYIFLKNINYAEDSLYIEKLKQFK